MRSGADLAGSEVASIDKDAEDAMRRGRAIEAGFSAMPDDQESVKQRVRPDVGEIIIMKDRMLSMEAHYMLRRSKYHGI